MKKPTCPTIAFGRKNKQRKKGAIHEGVKAQNRQAPKELREFSTVMHNRSLPFRFTFTAVML